MELKDVIVEHPEWQTPKQKFLIGFVTAGFWMAWFYLWIPFISLLAWLFGIRTFEYHMIELGGYDGLFKLLGYYGIVVFILGGSLVGWAMYNIRRFKGVDRRGVRPLVPLETQAGYFNVSADDLEKWQKSQLILIEHGHVHAVSRAH